MTRVRLAADGPLALLIGAGAAFVTALAVLIARQAPAAFDPFVACETVATTVAARLGSVGILLPSGVLSVVVLAAGLALVHQMWATRRVLARVLGRRRPLSPRLRRLAQAAGIAGRLDLVDDRAAFTFCYGLASPRVCVSSGLARLLSDGELTAVLRHEAHHLRHRDPLKILLGRTAASGLFFLPLAGALRNSFLGAKELCADADATVAGGELPLARALFKLLGAERPRWPAGVLAVGGLSPTEARVRQILEPQTIRPVLPSPADWIVSLALVAGIFGFSVGSAAANQAEAVHTACAPAATITAAPTAGIPGAHVHPSLLSAPPGALECDARCLGYRAD